MPARAPEPPWRDGTGPRPGPAGRIPAPGPVVQRDMNGLAGWAVQSQNIQTRGYGPHAGSLSEHPLTDDRSADHLPDTEPPVKQVAEASLPTAHGTFRIHVFESRLDGATHVALVCGDLGDGERVLARVHSSCVTGDIFHSSRCDCGQQLELAMRRVAQEGRGVVLYLFQEGRGIGLANKIRAYALQEQGRDTVEANEQLGFDADMRDYTSAVHMFRLLGVKSLRLMSNNPRKLEGVTDGALAIVERVPLEVSPSENNRRYLKTKKDKLGHKLSKV